MFSRLDSEQPDVHDGGTILLKPGSTVDTQPLTALRKQLELVACWMI
jgi:hypothetical protein